MFSLSLLLENYRIDIRLKLLSWTVMTALPKLMFSISMVVIIFNFLSFLSENFLSYNQTFRVCACVCMCVCVLFISFTLLAEREREVFASFGREYSLSALHLRAQTPARHHVTCTMTSSSTFGWILVLLNKCTHTSAAPMVDYGVGVLNVCTSFLPFVVWFSFSSIQTNKVSMKQPPIE